MNQALRRSTTSFAGALLRAAAVALALAGILGIGAPLPAADASPGGTIRAPRPDEVTPEAELAIARGLGWLVRTQGGDGSWSADSQTYPVAMTALAGIALLSSGSTATRGPYSTAIRRAEAFILASSDPSSGLISAGWEERPMHGHAFAMMFLAQVLGQEESLERREEIKAVLRRAVTLTSRAQTKNGGWYYRPNSTSDEGTLTVTMMQGLRACHDAGIHVPKEIIDRGVGYIEKSTMSDGRVRYRLNSSQVREGVTCAAVVALWSAGRYEDELLKRIVGYMDRAINPNWGTSRNHATYVQYYLGQAKFLLGGARWTQFYRIESRLLAGAQESDGSWLTEEERSAHGVGAVYSTSVALIILQLPYNRLPIFQR